MPLKAPTLPDACREHIDGINKALADGKYDQAFYLAYQYFRARAVHVRKTSPQDADGFRRQGAYLLAGLASGMYRNHPAEEFRFAAPLVPGGDWTPRGGDGND